MNKEQKTAVVEEIADQITAAEAIFAVDYRGLSVAQAAELRAKLGEVDAKFRVVKNSLTERAADRAGIEDLKPLLVGPTALTLVHGDAALAARALNDTARRLNLLEFKGGLLNGTVLSAADVRSIARLPAREVLQAQLVATIAAPLTGLVRGLNALISGLAIQLKAIADMDPPVLTATAPPAVGEPPTAPEASAPMPVDAEAAAEPEGAAEPEAEAEVPAEPEAEAEVPAEPEAEVPAEPEAEVESPAVANAEPQAETTPESEQDTASDADPSDE
jgi:large subunit ribosomal protein L10